MSRRDVRKNNGVTVERVSQIRVRTRVLAPRSYRNSMAVVLEPSVYRKRRLRAPGDRHGRKRNVGREKTRKKHVIRNSVLTPVKCARPKSERLPDDIVVP